jgi:peptidoglycan L-alanyl-D-glutamate endopeptidase CwlK
MSNYLLYRIDTNLIYPPFLAKVEQALAACEAQGAVYVATLGFRTYTEQNELWSQGRTKPGSIVTRARGGESQHNFGLAIDFVRDGDPEKPGVQPWWQKKDYQILADEVNKAGLHSGRGYGDYPHVGWHQYIGNATLPSLRVLHSEWCHHTRAGQTSLDRLKNVWRIIDGK